MWPSLVKGKVYVPLRVFVSALGGTASYNSRIDPRVADSVILRYAAPVVPFYSAPVEPFFSNIIEQFHAPDVQQRKAEIIKEYRASELSGRTADTLRSDYNGNRSSFEPPQVYASSGPTPTAAQMNAYSAMTALSLSVFSDGALSYSYSF